MARPVVALLTDFGLAQHFVASMKGIVLGLCPDASLVDISHEVPPHDVREAALLLQACWRDFPPGTVFLAVVDPGVGSARRALAAEAGGQRFVAPDNGVLGAVFDECPPARIVELAHTLHVRPVVGRTFEGRDRFAPAAGRLAAGADLDTLGSRVTGYVDLRLPEPLVQPGRIEGEILQVDRFGNLITNIDERALKTAGLHAHVRVTVGTFPPGRLVATYSEIRDDEIGALVGSTGRLEVAARSSSAASRLGVGRGARVTITADGGDEISP